MFPTPKSAACATAVLIALSGAAFGQTTTTNPATAPATNATTTVVPVRDDTRGFDWGWLGLLGLLGLAGLTRKDRPHVVGTQSTVR